MHLDAQGRHIKLLNFEMKVMKILEAKAYEITDEEKIPVIKNWLGRRGLQLIKTFTKKGKEKCKMPKGLFPVLSHKLKPCHNKIVLLLQYLKLKRKSHKSNQEWMGRLCTKAAEYDYKKHNRKLRTSYTG